MKSLFDSFENLKGATLISVNNYLAKKSGEVANHVINVNISVLNAKTKDLATLKQCKVAVLKQISAKSFIDLPIVKLAFSEMLASSEKNLAPKKEDRTKQSTAQTDAYFNLTPAIRLNKETREIHIFGQAIQKTVITAGEYKKVNSSNKTIAKKLITKELNLRAGKYRNFILGHIDNLKINGESINVVNC